MFTKIGDRIKRKIERGVDKISRPSSPKPSSSVPVNDSGSTSNPVPAASLRLPVSESRGLLAPPHSSSQIGSISAPRSAVASLALPSTDTLSPAPQPVNSGSPSSPDPVPAKLTTTTSAGSTGPEQSGRSAAWSGLGALLGLLKDTAVAFGPLKDAVGGIQTCVEIYEEAAKGRDDYKKLRAELDSLFWELFGLLGGPTPPSMTFSLANLARCCADL
ncbi:hypothetical protein BDV93DRAFT_513427 [Ceratobasidium sp. AG-I]|nr:hypothetical protein BDV93DRAFT_513427 [Ceratobasidium sp. AG-I]